MVVATMTFFADECHNHQQRTLGANLEHVAGRAAGSTVSGRAAGSTFSGRAVFGRSAVGAGLYHAGVVEEVGAGAAAVAGDAGVRAGSHRAVGPEERREPRIGRRQLGRSARSRPMRVSATILAGTGQEPGRRGRPARPRWPPPAARRERPAPSVVLACGARMSACGCSRISSPRTWPRQDGPRGPPCRVHDARSAAVDLIRCELSRR